MRALAVGLVCAACSAARPTAPVANAGGPSDQPPQLEELREILAAFDDRALPAGCPAEGTLGPYVDDIYEQGTIGAGAGVNHYLAGGCVTDADYAPARPGYWTCDVHSYREFLDESPPFEHGVTFYVKLTDRSADPSSLACRVVRRRL